MGKHQKELARFYTADDVFLRFAIRGKPLNAESIFEFQVFRSAFSRPAPSNKSLQVSAKQLLCFYVVFFP